MDVGTPKQLGDGVRALRRRRGLTQQQLAEAAGMSRQYLVGLEAGTVNPTWNVVARVAASLGVDVSFTDPQDVTPPGPSAAGDIDLDQLLDAHRERSPLPAGWLRAKRAGT